MCATTYKTFVPAVPDEDGSLFLMAVRPTTEMAKMFCAIVKRHLADRGLGDDFYEYFILSAGDQHGEGPACIWIRSRVRG